MHKYFKNVASFVTLLSKSLCVFSDTKDASCVIGDSKSFDIFLVEELLIVYVRKEAQNIKCWLLLRIDAKYRIKQKINSSLFA